MSQQQFPEGETPAFCLFVIRLSLNATLAISYLFLCQFLGDSLSLKVSANVEMSGVWVEASRTDLVLHWQTASEPETAGFYVKRATNVGGPYTRIEGVYIAPEGNTISGADYQYLDNDAKAGTTYYYFVEAIDNNNSINDHGPVCGRLGQSIPCQVASPTPPIMATATQAKTVPAPSRTPSQAAGDKGSRATPSATAYQAPTRRPARSSTQASGGRSGSEGGVSPSDTPRPSSTRSSSKTQSRTSTPEPDETEKSSRQISSKNSERSRDRKTGSSSDSPGTSSTSIESDGPTTADQAADVGSVDAQSGQNGDDESAQLAALPAGTQGAQSEDPAGVKIERLGDGLATRQAGENDSSALEGVASANRNPFIIMLGLLLIFGLGFRLLSLNRSA